MVGYQEEKSRGIERHLMSPSQETYRLHGNYYKSLVKRGRRYEAIEKYDWVQNEIDHVTNDCNRPPKFAIDVLQTYK